MNYPELNHQDLVWILRRTPAKVRELLMARPGQVFLAGGFIRSVIAQEDVNDIDLFVPTKDAAVAVAMALKGANERIRLVETQNAWTVVMKPYTVQIISRWLYSDPLVCLSEFDFTIAQAAIWYEKFKGNPIVEGQWHTACAPTYYSDLAAKRLVYCAPKRAEDAGGSMLRVLKFYQRGYRIPMDSLGAVIARLTMGVNWELVNDRPDEWREPQLAKVITGLLREVDPNIDPTHQSHLPASDDEPLPEDLL